MCPHASPHIYAVWLQRAPPASLHISPTPDQMYQLDHGPFSWKQWNFNAHLNHLQDLTKDSWLGPTSRVSSSGSLAQAPSSEFLS